MSRLARSSAAMPPPRTSTVESGTGLELPEQPVGVFQALEDRLGHAILNPGGHGRALTGRQRRAVGRLDPVRGAALDASHVPEAAVARDIGRLGRPGRHRAQARHDQHQLAPRLDRRARGPVGEQALEPRALFRLQRAGGFDEMPELGADAGDAGNSGRRGFEELVEPEGRERYAPSQPEYVRHGEC